VTNPNDVPGPWPPGYEPDVDLSGDGRVVRARWRGELVVVRRGLGASTDEVGAELDVLSTVRHRGLARWTDHGVLPDGTPFVARRWVAGEPLDVWAAGRDPARVGRVIARLCGALAALHEHRFVHADLKPANVVVDGEQPTLTDFGLTAPSGRASAGGPSGSAFYIAPECLLGAPPSPAGDRFALGVLLFALLGGELGSSERFYGRFPSESFLAAVGGSVDRHPEWCRDLIADLVSRVPGRRPEAARVAELLARRLGVELAASAPAPRLALEHGRERWFDERARADVHTWIHVPEDEDLEGVADAIAVRVTRAGRRVARIDGSAEIDRLRDSAELDAWVDERVTTAPGATLVVTVRDVGPWRARALEYLARVGGQADGADGSRVIVCTASTREPGVLWRTDRIPLLSAEALAAFLVETLDASGDRARALAAQLATDGSVAITRINRALDELVREGRLRWMGDSWQLLPGEWIERVAEPPSRSASVADPEARVLLHAIDVAGPDGTGLDGIVRLSGLEQDAAAEALRRLDEEGWIRITRGPNGRRVERGAAIPPGADPEHTRLRRRYVAQLDEAGDAGDRRLPHAVALGEESAAAELVQHVRGLREQGEPERALDLVERCQRTAREEDRELPREAVFEYALAWCTFGELERANGLARQLDERGASALAERVRAHVALAKGDFASAGRSFARARSSDPNDRGDALYGEVRVLFEEGRHAEVVERVAEVERAAATPSLDRRVRANLRSLAALAELRRGHVESAFDALEAERVAAVECGDSPLEAVTLLNLATVERRRARFPQAIELLERAVRIHERAGRLAAAAQARAMLGRSLRDDGRPAESVPLLLAAARARERLGDRAGGSAARGMAGLSLADCGHLHAARQELAAGAAALAEVGRRADAALFEARRDLIEARLGRDVPAGSASDERDPRAMLWRARAQWLRGAPTRARSAAAQAARRARELGLRRELAEARAVCAWLDAEVVPPDGGSTDDVDIVHWLTSATRDPEHGRRLLERLERAGRDDRAARVLLALASDAPDKVTLGRCLAPAWAAFERCAAGLTEAERAALRRNLLARPDPHTSDLRAFGASTETDDMDVLALLDINHRLLEGEELEPLLGTIVEEAMRVCGAERGFLVLEEQGELSFDRAMDSSRGDIGEPDLEVSRSIVERALSEGAPLRIGDALGDSSFGGARSVNELRLRSVLCAPFRVRDDLRGVVYVDHRGKPAAFSEHDERLLGLLADQAGLAVRQRLMHDELKRANKRLSRAVAQRDSELEGARRALKVAGVAVPASGLVGGSSVMRTIHEAIARAAPTTLPVLVHGASGTGKELCARAIHAQSPRSQKPLVVENCAALPASLIESELFGYRRGAFTGANEDRAGLFERADGGTLFLDEIGELPADLQAKLLRVLESGEVRRLGDSESRTVDVRLVAATNRDLPTEVEEGRFRSDLYYRLDGLSIRMPSLEEHVDDIPELVEHFLRLDEARTGVRRGVDPAVVERLCRRPWPGNVRELANEVSRLIVLSAGDLVDPSLVREPGPQLRGAHGTSEPGRVVPLLQLEREAILRALEATGGDKREAAKLLGISRAKIYQRLKAWEEADE